MKTNKITEGLGVILLIWGASKTSWRNGKFGVLELLTKGFLKSLTTSNNQQNVWDLSTDSGFSILYVRPLPKRLMVI